MMLRAMTVVRTLLVLLTASTIPATIATAWTSDLELDSVLFSTLGGAVDAEIVLQRVSVSV